MRVRAREYVRVQAGAGGCECYLYSEALRPEHEVGYRAGIEHIEHIPHLQGRVNQDHADRAGCPCRLTGREKREGGGWEAGDGWVND